MPGLDEFPPDRRLALLWRYVSPERGEAEVDALLRAASPVPCSTGRDFKDRPAGDLVAVRGSDSRYHLVIDGRPQCTGLRAEDVTSGLHCDLYSFWTDGDRYQTYAPLEAMDFTGEFPKVVIGAHVYIEYRWTVTLDFAQVIDPDRVRRRDRCTTYSPAVYWPGYTGGTEMGQVRARLVAVFGSLCAACGTQPGSTVDHDHFTGYVRGLLCNFCNTHVDGCPHLAGCPFADYLNNPPAASWKMFYPKSRRGPDSTFTAAKIAAVGYDPRFRSRAAQRAKEPHRPAPIQASGLDLSMIAIDPLF